MVHREKNQILLRDIVLILKSQFFEDSAEFQNTWKNHIPDSGGGRAVNQNKETTAPTLKPSVWSSWGTDK